MVANNKNVGVSAGSNQQGFVLTAVLWALAIMFIAVGIFHAYVQRKMVLGIQAKAHMQQELDQVSTEQTILYLLGTSRFTLSGMTFTELSLAQANDENFSFLAPIGDELWMDGTVYEGIGDVRFSVQDNAGLVAINSPDPAVLMQLLNHFEPDAGIKTRLVSALQDYIDANDQVRIAGAEKADYLQKGMVPPTNDYLRTEAELLRVMGWREWLSAHPEVDVQGWFSTRRISTMNLNTMPPSLLMSLYGINEATALQILTERKTNPFHSTEEFMLRTNTANINDEHIRFAPSNELRLSFWNKGGGQARLISLQLTPNGLLGPWLVDYEYSVQSVKNNNEPLALRQTKLFDHTLGAGR